MVHDYSIIFSELSLFEFFEKFIYTSNMMKYSLITKNSEEFIWNTLAGSDAEEMSFLSEYQVEFSRGQSSGNNWICKLKPGLIISFTDVMPKEDIYYKIEAREDLIKFAFSLSGKGSFDFRFIDRQLKGGERDELVYSSFVYFSPVIEGKGKFRANYQLQELSIHINPGVLLNYLNGQFDIGPYALRDILAGSDQVSFFHSARLSNSMIIAIHQILNCNFYGRLRYLLLESKAMELITYKLDQIIQDRHEKIKSSEMSKDDYNRLKQATEILNRNLENPPGLFDLAKHIGTTHSRLNFCFRKAYNTTVFGYLRQLRLEKAKQLLEKEGLNVTQAAYSVGYNSVPSFSKAFLSHFGMNPTKFIKKIF